MLGQLFDLHIQGVEARAFRGDRFTGFRANSRLSFRQPVKPAVRSPTCYADSTAMTPAARHHRGSAACDSRVTPRGALHDSCSQHD